MEVDDEELERRRRESTPRRATPARGYAALYVDHVLQAHEGCDFDFLVGRSPNPSSEPQGVFDGWVGGW